MTEPEPTRLHQWEDINPGLARLTVPGGWLYRMALWGDYNGLDPQSEIAFTVTFVPNPGAEIVPPAVEVAEEVEALTAALVEAISTNLREIATCLYELDTKADRISGHLRGLRDHFVDGE